ncbi:phosphoenolpyruvate carboxylase [Aureococcus anophagefferens]|nr:phosphoenolpyruvate carboxylase [Aureococcus anophagefferens]
MLGLRSALRSTARGAALVSPPRSLSTLPSSFEEMERLDPGGAAYADQRVRHLATQRLGGSALFPEKRDSCAGVAAGLLDEGVAPAAAADAARAEDGDRAHGAPDGARRRPAADASPVALASWMGGDRDGNPNVDAAVTRSVVAAQRRKGASLLIVELDALRLDLSVTGASDAVVALAKTFAGDEPVREPYKAVCDGFIGRLRATIRWADGALDEAEWPTARAARCSAAATSKLVDGDFVEDAVDRDVLKTCAYVAEAPPDTFGAYVISQATSAADVLAVELLLHEAGAASDRSNCTRVEIMVGYSDSAKDAGRLAAWWAQYEGQEKMLAVCDEFGVEATFFHGKGGTVGRGGNPETYRAILAHPPNTIDGRFRVTEQGEMIAFNFGEPPRADADIFSAAVFGTSSATLGPRDAPGPAGLARHRRRRGADGAELRAMYEEWPWFKTNVDLIETLLAKLEPEIAKHYDAVLVGGGEPRLAALATAALRAKHDGRGPRRVGRGAPAEGNELLMRALKLRNPYVDVLTCPGRVPPPHPPRRRRGRLLRR